MQPTCNIAGKSATIWSVATPARLDGKLLATVRRAGIDWVVRWQTATVGETTAPLSYPLRESVVAAVEKNVLRLIAAGELQDVRGRAGEELP